MLWQDRNGTWYSTLSVTDFKIMNNTDHFIENTKLVAEKTGNLDLWQEMFGDIDDGRGEDSAFMDDTFGG